jgi:putative transcriptional regulator
MTHYPNMNFSTSATIEDSLSARLEAIRLSRNITQSRLARDAGVSRSTITRLAQHGKGISLDSFIRILQALNLENQLETLLPTPKETPLERLAKPTKTRKRARARTRGKNVIDHADAWTWEDNAGAP